MITRLGITIALIGIAYGAYTAGTRWQTRHIAAVSPILGQLQPGIPAVIYFWSEGCAPCRLVQKPALEQLQAELAPAGVQVIAVNALEETDMADEWGVLSLPTTFILDTSGKPRRVNHGVTRAEQLREQILSL